MPQVLRLALTVMAPIWALAGCATGAFPEPKTAASGAAPAEIPIEAVWSRQPTALVALRRASGAWDEQVVALPNRTTVPGDNLLVMRGRPVGAGHIGPFSPEALFADAGGTPAPFDADVLGALRVSEDAAGPVLWTEKRIGAGVVCALGLRRLDAERNLVQEGFSMVDVMLRNCVEGTLEEAMAPLRPDRIAIGAPTRPADPDAARPRLLSPLAGPRPGGAIASVAAEVRS